MYRSKGLDQADSSEGHLEIWNHRATRGNSNLGYRMNKSAATEPWSKLRRVGSRMNWLFSSSNVLRIEGLNGLEEEAISLARK